MAERGFTFVVGHEELRRRLAAAVAQGRLPQSLIFQGPRGVGKQRLAIWTAAVLNCSSDERPCGDCRSCRLIDKLQHPDVHWFFPLPRPRASGPEALAKKLEDARAEALEARRENPYYVDTADGATGIYVAAVQTMRRLAQSTPAMGPAKVLIVGQAESLIPQMGSHEAANALLKLLEEPPADTTVILTSDVPGALLATIRSRVQAIRLARHPDSVVERFLRDELELEAPEAKRLASRSGGSIGRALSLVAEEESDARDAALALLGALLDGSPAARYSAAHSYRAFGARGTFTRALGELTAQLRDLLAVAAGAPDAATDAELISSQRRRPAPSAESLMRALAAVERARTLAERNVNPQLTVANLLAEAGGLR